MSEETLDTSDDDQEFDGLEQHLRSISLAAQSDRQLQTLFECGRAAGAVEATRRHRRHVFLSGVLMSLTFLFGGAVGRWISVLDSSTLKSPIATNNALPQNHPRMEEQSAAESYDAITDRERDRLGLSSILRARGDIEFESVGPIRTTATSLRKSQTLRATDSIEIFEAS